LTPLQSWTDGPTKAAIVDFVGRAVADVPPEERVAVFDNDGTLWAEKPAYIQLDFLLRRMRQQVTEDPSLKDNAAYKAAADGDLAWFGDVVTKHYNGDDSGLKILGPALFSAYAGLSVEEHAAKVREFFSDGTHPTLGVPYTACGYAPMVELLRYLEANGFTNYIVSGGGRDFMRPITGSMYGIPPERVVGTAMGLEFADGEVRTTSTLEFLDDGPVKPVRIWARTGRRPIFAAGNSNGDIEMLQYATHGDRPSLAMLVLHDDADREFDYVAGAEKSLELAKSNGWTVTSIRTDWTTVFGG
jgi:phosphoglycolate phosphatase-like HAD superfamily hydrolase